MMFVYIQLLLC